MKSVTISVADDVSQRASQKAAAEATSLPDVVQGLLADGSQASDPSPVETVEERRQAEFLRFLDELAARPRTSGTSVGPLNREELYQRGVPGRQVCLKMVKHR